MVHAASACSLCFHFIHTPTSHLLRYAPGGSITGMLRRFGALPEETIRVYTLHILLGLNFLHSTNIVHRQAVCRDVCSLHIDALNIILGTSKVQMFLSTLMDAANSPTSAVPNH